MSGGLYQFLSMRGAMPAFVVLDELDGFDHVATETESHAEWHRNTGQKYGCPWDCCEPPEHCPVCDFEYLDDDGVCPRAADDPEHDLRMADYLSSRLCDVAPDPEEVKSDPWF